MATFRDGAMKHFFAMQPRYEQRDLTQSHLGTDLSSISVSLWSDRQGDFGYQPSPADATCDVVDGRTAPKKNIAVTGAGARR
jgi:hypothetical protein